MEGNRKGTEFGSIPFGTEYVRHERRYYAADGSGHSFTAEQLRAAQERISEALRRVHDRVTRCMIIYPGLPQDRLGEVFQAAAQHVPRTAAEVGDFFTDDGQIRFMYRRATDMGIRGERLARGMERMLRHRLGILGTFADSTLVYPGDSPDPTDPAWQEAAWGGGTRYTPLALASLATELGKVPGPRITHDPEIATPKIIRWEDRIGVGIDWGEEGGDRTIQMGPLPRKD